VGAPTIHSSFALLAACGSGSSADLTDLAGHTGNSEVVAKALGDVIANLGADEQARFSAGQQALRAFIDTL
jgi:hypothetical protein